MPAWRQDPATWERLLRPSPGGEPIASMPQKRRAAAMVLSRCFLDGSRMKQVATDAAICSYASRRLPELRIEKSRVDTRFSTVMLKARTEVASEVTAKTHENRGSNRSSRQRQGLGHSRAAFRRCGPSQSRFRRVGGRGSSTSHCGRTFQACLARRRNVGGCCWPKNMNSTFR